MTIKAIETRYNGYRFRSRLEARWAVFFDAMGIRWEYEKEGYELPEASFMQNGKKWFDYKTSKWYWGKSWFASCYYLPDFYLTDLDYWFEVKGSEPSLEEQSKLGRLAKETGKHGFIAYGDIGYKDVYQLHWWWPANSLIASSIECSDWFLDVTWGEDEAGKVDICLNCGIGSLAAGINDIHAIGWDEWSGGKLDNYQVTPRLLAAYEAARSARFEYGETPRVLRGKPR